MRSRLRNWVKISFQPKGIHYFHLPKHARCTCTITLELCPFLYANVQLRVAWRFHNATQFVKSKSFGRQLMMVTMLQLSSGQRCLDQMLLNSSLKPFRRSFGHVPRLPQNRAIDIRISVTVDIGCYVLYTLFVYMPL